MRINYFKLKTTTLAFCCSFLPLTGPASAQLSLIAPRDNTYVETSLITLVTKSSLKNGTAYVNGQESGVAGVFSGNFHLSFSPIRLSPGRNTIRITAGGDGGKSEETSATIYFRSDLSPAASSPPASFTRFLFHTNEGERLCSSCHQMDFSGAADNLPSPDKSPCYDCHKGMLNGYRMVHGPAAVWSCTSCHEPGNKKRKLSTVKPDDKICSLCHEYKWMKMKYMHGPTAAGSCTTCHNPHGENHESFLRMNTADLCAACHDDILTRPHVISGFSGNAGHPVRLSPDPLNPGRDFTCASCHNPHGTDFPLMLKSDHNSMFQFCQSCHRM